VSLSAAPANSTAPSAAQVTAVFSSSPVLSSSSRPLSRSRITMRPVRATRRASACCRGARSAAVRAPASDSCAAAISGDAGTRRKATRRPSGQKLASPPSSVAALRVGAAMVRTRVRRPAPAATPADTAGPVSNEK